MTEALEILDGLPGDLESIEKLYPDAFPDEDLLPLVRQLLAEGPIVLSLVGVMGQSIRGHVVFTMCGIAGRPDRVALLGPLAVASAWQRRGIGSAMVRAGMDRLDRVGVTRVYVLGDPAYYGRLGFVREVGIAPPYPLPANWLGAWQSLSLGRVEGPCRGQLSLPQPWLQRSLWAP